MSDATYVQLPQPARKKPYWRGKRLIIPAIIILLLVAVCCVSWWYEQGKISSVYANVDAVVYTVEPEAPVRIQEVLVKKGDKVFPGQPLAMIEMEPPTPQPADSGMTHGVMPMGEITGRLNASEEAERNMSARLAQARAQEERFQQAHQNYVTEHVRAQLQLRAINPHDQVAWATANAQEQAARARMEAARVQFEQVSKMRAAMDMELARIRSEIFRKKLQASRAPAQAPKQIDPPKLPKPVDTALLAPANGKILEVFAAPGQQAQTGQSLFFILPADKGKGANSWIQAWFPIADQGKLKTGLPVAIDLDKWKLTGKITAIAPEPQYLPTADPASAGGSEIERYILVKITVNEPEALMDMTPGATAKCFIQAHKVPGLDWLLGLFT